MLTPRTGKPSTHHTLRRPTQPDSSLAAGSDLTGASLTTDRRPGTESFRNHPESARAPMSPTFAIAPHQ
jgi:hypothetical protein